METEKNKIEFWDSYQTIECALFGHKPKKPMIGYITEANQIVSLTIDKRESRIPGIPFFVQEVE